MKLNFTINIKILLMEKIFDISVINTLKDGIKKGWWTLEDLDTPPPGWV